MCEVRAVTSRGGQDAGHLPSLNGLVHLAVPSLTYERAIRIRLSDFSGFAPMGAAKARRQMVAEQGCTREYSLPVPHSPVPRRVSALPSGAVQPMLLFKWE